MAEAKRERIRKLGYLTGILSWQRRDPLCRECKSYERTLDYAREEFEAIGGAGGEADGFGELYGMISEELSGLAPPEEPVPQRKLGACRFEGRICLLKKSMRMIMPEEG